ncbi:MAG: prepilin-type N-terminal cleavage/methylation domain-containing protein [Phycisphaera sp.]|nr:prepilin-type N-terminal cleavage/methylation domain-containing protein [Phycisphaera sp.]
MGHHAIPSRRPRRTTRRDARGFTIVELLVVMSILVLLLSIVLPSMARSREIGRRAVCASRQHQTHMTVLSIASDRFSQLPDTQRDTDNQDHVTWVNHDLFERFQEYAGLEPFKFTGPNDTEFIADRQMDIFYCANRRDWERNTSFGHRLGFFYLFGRGGKLPLPWSGDDPDRPWTKSPRMLHDDPTLLFLSDIVEQGTVVPNVTSLAHASNGPSMTIAGAVDDPGQLGGEGVNSTYLDGSVRWRSQGALVCHSSTKTGGIKGWW